ncbi:ZNFX1-like protein [Mya arenaria]|uniref:ZNFX1-like protein n=1 Tax=Mya arenaria TaxID=6604 RepID=A0ABY7DD74_MYAAR|nr:NFX1-type zinc finger-containing protein 1-like [Mya arenaria]WAQ95602.1 ZNFX1-like protein [Mya arenaria]
MGRNRPSNARGRGRGRSYDANDERRRGDETKQDESRMYRPASAGRLGVRQKESGVGSIASGGNDDDEISKPQKFKGDKSNDWWKKQKQERLRKDIETANKRRDPESATHGEERINRTTQPVTRYENASKNSPPAVQNCSSFQKSFMPDDRVGTLTIGDNKRKRNDTLALMEKSKSDPPNKSATQQQSETTARPRVQSSDQRDGIDKVSYTYGCRPKTTFFQGQATEAIAERHDRFEHYRNSASQQDRGHQTIKPLIRPQSREHPSQERGERPTSFISLDRLKRLKSENPSKIVLELSASVEILKETIHQCNSDNKLFDTLLEVFARCYDTHSVTQSMVILFDVLNTGNFFGTLQNHLLDLQNEFELDPTSTKQRVQMKRTVTNTFKIMWEQVARNPSSHRLFSRLYNVLKQIIDDPDFSNELSERTVLDFKEFGERKRSFEKELKVISVKPKSDGPPDDFRDIPVLPTSGEIKGIVRPYLRKNKKDGDYDDLDHYLDVQFRLLREDYIGPLRDGVFEHIKQLKQSTDITGKKNRNKNLKIYPNVTVVAPLVSEQGLCYKMKMGMTSRMKKIKWGQGKRLIYGSLVCLTDNNFDTFILATIVENDDLEAGYFTIHIEDDSVDTANLFGKVFIMAETSAYFESYKHVLLSLQTYRDGDLPFEKYIVFCDTDCRPPAYLNPESTFDLRSLIDVPLDTETEDVTMEEIVDMIDKTSDTSDEDNYTARAPSVETELSNRDYKEVQILDESKWPSNHLLSLDESQMKAVQNALTREFAVVQGPPGTGKTYIGLKIAKALLLNQKVWCPMTVDGVLEKSPLLVVCYTNHALDQFLEGIKKFFRGDILRVGGRSNSNILSGDILKNRRQRVYLRDPQVEKMRTLKEEARRTIESLRENIGKLALTVELQMHEVVHEDHLGNVIGELHMQQLKGENVINSPQLMHWLPVNFLYQKCRQDCRNKMRKVEEKHTEAAVDLGQQRRTAQMLLGDILEDFPKTNKMALLREVRKESVVYSVDRRHIDDLTHKIEHVIRQLKHRWESLKNERKHLRELEIRFERNRLNHTARERAVLKNQIANNAGQIELLEARKKSLENELRNEIEFNKLMESALHEYLSSPLVFTDEEVMAIHDVWALNLEDRWKLYRYWVKRKAQQLYETIDGRKGDYKVAAQRFQEAQILEDKELMRKSEVIGMTTTCAAKYQSALRDIKPKIVIVEEAAEVLEAHIVTTLSRGCQHLILIGDHKQLRPNPTVHRLAVKYNLNISLFERMINNGVMYNCLHLQHRMRPEIADVMRHIYPGLQDHPQVETYEMIRGVATDIQLINHSYQETMRDEIRSYANPHEAAFVFRLCEYMLLQGYDPSQITVLTTYTGQLFELKRQIPKDGFRGMRITVVDNYQGEENDIVILSLVRSNPENRIGFLKIENRVCVALSRAKMGFYVLGNFDQFSKCSMLWKTIYDHARERGQAADGLKIVGSNHPEDGEKLMTDPADFLNAPAGCCSRDCEARLECGHKCKQKCHVMDIKHLRYHCNQMCSKTCENGHPCEARCFKQCPPCQVPMQKTVQRCGHKQTVACSIPLNNICCQHEPCPRKLKCGHDCPNKCGYPHEAKCEITVKKSWDCGHSADVICYEKDTLPCPEPCQNILACEHLCSGTCGTCYNGRLHEGCNASCNRILICGHECQSTCSNCPPCTADCENRCVHSKCMKLCGKPCQPCKEKCVWECEHFKCSKLCSEPCDRPPCNEPCKSLLECGHPCIGLCGEPCPTQCRYCHEEVTEIFFGDEDESDARFVKLDDCGHIFEYQALDKYIEMENEDGAVRLKECPKCKTPIRKCVRYGNKINECIANIELVKRKLIGSKTEIGAIRLDLKKSLHENHLQDNARGCIHPRFRANLEQFIVSESNDIITKQSMLNMKAKYDAMRSLTTVVDGFTYRTNMNDLDYDSKIKKFFQSISIRLSKSSSILTEQLTHDIQREYTRGQLFSEYLRLNKDLDLKTRPQTTSTLLERIAKRAGKLVPPTEDEDDSSNITDGKLLTERTREILVKPAVFTEDDEKEVKASFETIRKLVNIKGLGITEEERASIVSAVKLTKGHWFKCPNNHVYAIGECGGATQKSKCPECQVEIGGEQHRLTEGNQLAPEMDGAAFAAYSEEANNMANFDLRGVH